MRKWINLVENKREPLEEKGLGHLAAAAALAGGGYQVGKDLNLPDVDPMPRIVVIPDSDGPPLDDSTLKLHTPSKTPSENINEATKLLALTIWGEGRSGGPDAMRAVAHVIVNRVHSDRAFGDTVKDVVWKRKAFSCWNHGDPNREAMKRIPSLSPQHLSKKRWIEAVDIARRVLSGEDQDPTNGALFYHTEAMGKPYWVSDNMKPIAHIGDHLFYRTDAKS
jgi:spore germination cell wall hydrolase CwlJ-like protein